MKKIPSLNPNTVVVTLLMLGSMQGFAEAPKAKAAPKETKEALTFSSDACTSSESWTFTSKIHSKWQDEFKSFLSRHTSDPWGFSEALALRRISESDEGKIFAEYWVSRALFNAKLYHIAFNGFSHIAGRPVEASSLGVQAAAMECLDEIQSKFPTMNLPESVAERIYEFSKFPQSKKVMNSVWRTAGTRLRDQVAEAKPRGDILRTMAVLQGGGAHEALAQTLYAARRGNHNEVLQWARAYQTSVGKPKFMARFEDPIRIIAARSLFVNKKFDEAAVQLKAVKKQSNELAETLSELSWAYLMNEKYREAIGTAINLQTGGLRKTYAPEASMVMSMAFNELCQYPKAVESVGVFRKTYHPSYQWLSHWEAETAKKGSPDLYQIALDYLKNKPIKVPEKVVSEWVRSPHFISRQDEVNLTFDEKESSNGLGRQGDLEQNKMAIELLKFTREFKRKYAIAKAQLKPNQDLPHVIYKDLERLKDMMTHYRRYRMAAPAWRTILATQNERAPAIVQKLGKEIHQEFAMMNKRMKGQLQEIAENNYFIEVEIYNGASQDIIWKNAYPDYEKIARDFNAEDAVQTSKVWNWGNVAFDLAGEGEIWEDELGSFKADVYDNCQNKEKYLALKKQVSQEMAKRHKVKE